MGAMGVLEVVALKGQTGSIDSHQVLEFIGLMIQSVTDHLGNASQRPCLASALVIYHSHVGPETGGNPCYQPTKGRGGREAETEVSSVTGEGSIVTSGSSNPRVPYHGGKVPWDRQTLH